MCLDNNLLITKIINDILDKKILEILKQINNVYPDKFPKKNIKLELEFIKTNIKLVNNVVPNNVVPNKKKYNIESQYRCNARIWNNIYDRATLKEVNDIDKKFKVKDFIDIKIKEFHSKYIVGTQCRKKKTEDSIYCHQHKKHCIHGNYFEIPTQELCLHYMKDGNYL